MTLRHCTGATLVFRHSWKLSLIEAAGVEGCAPPLKPFDLPSSQGRCHGLDRPDWRILASRAPPGPEGPDIGGFRAELATSCGGALRNARDACIAIDAALAAALRAAAGRYYHAARTRHDDDDTTTTTHQRGFTLGEGGRLGLVIAGCMHPLASAPDVRTPYPMLARSSSWPTSPARTWLTTSARATGASHHGGPRAAARGAWASRSTRRWWRRAAPPPAASGYPRACASSSRTSSRQIWRSHRRHALPQRRSQPQAPPEAPRRAQAGSRIVSDDFDMGDWRPACRARADEGASRSCTSGRAARP